MRGNNNRKVGEIVKKLMNNPNISHRLDKLDALDAWEYILGTQLCKYITEQKIHKGVLYVNLKSAVVRNELSYKKTDFIKQINEQIGKDIIIDIVLR